jgi:BASS family bile acid:Na+ symporter
VSVLFVAALLVASMTAVGTALTTTDLRAVARRPVALLLIVVLNAAVVPGLAVAACAAAGLPAAATLGIVLAAAAPGGGTGALLTLHARGELALSAGLQGALAPVGLVAVPVWAAVAGYDVVPPGWGGVLLVGGGLAGQPGCGCGTGGRSPRSGCISSPAVSPTWCWPPWSSPSPSRPAGGCRSSAGRRSRWRRCW